MTNRYPRHSVSGQARPANDPVLTPQKRAHAPAAVTDEVEIVSCRAVTERIVPDSTDLPAAKRVQHDSKFPDLAFRNDSSPGSDEIVEIRSTLSTTYLSSSAAKMAQLDDILKAGERGSTVRTLKQKHAKQKESFRAKEVKLELRIAQLESCLSLKSEVLRPDEKSSAEQMSFTNRIQTLENEKLQLKNELAAQHRETEMLKSQMRPEEALCGGAAPRSKVLEQQQMIATLESEVENLTRDCARHRNSTKSLKFQIIGLSRDRVKQQARLEQAHQQNKELEGNLGYLKKQSSAALTWGNQDLVRNLQKALAGQAKYREAYEANLIELELERTKIRGLEVAIQQAKNETQAYQNAICEKDETMSELQVRHDLLSEQFGEAKNEIQALIRTKLDAEEQLSKIEVERHPSNDAYKTEIKILRTHNEELLKDNHILENNIRATQIEIVDLKADLAEQKQMCKDATLVKQRLQIETEKAGKQLQKPEKIASENTSIVKQLLKTRLDLEVQLRQRDGQIAALQTTAQANKEAKKEDKVARKELSTMKKALKAAEARTETVSKHYTHLHTKNNIMLGRLAAMATAGGFGNPELDSLKAPSLDELYDLWSSK